MTSERSTILGIGNPLLDISAVVGPEMLQKYNLKPNDAILYEKEDIFEDITSNFEVEYIAGGATQNTCRVAQWILGKPLSVAYFGCIGTDDNESILEKVATEAGIKVRYQKSEDHPTGRCAVLVNEHKRSLVTKLDAANHYTTDHLEDPENWKLVEEASIFYSAGFFLTVCPEAMLKVAEHAAHDPSKKFCMNLSAPFICEFFKDPLNKVMEYADIVVGNETEVEAYAKHNGMAAVKDRKEIALKISQLPYKGNSAKFRTVIVTQGCDPVIVVEDSQISEHPVHPLSEDEIVDTNGAGDAFVGGFLSQLAKGVKTHDAIDCGLWAAAAILKVSGCKCDPEKQYPCA